jgi:hypothetical protein
MTVEREIKRSSVRGASASNPLNRDLALASVVYINTEEMVMQLRVFGGVDTTHDPYPVPITLPGAGKRGVLGRIPSLGDLCVVAFMSNNTETLSTPTPVPIAWFPAPARDGKVWSMIQDLQEGEGFDSIGQRHYFEGILSRTRLKLRHYVEGSVFAASDQGSDLILDEDALLTNRAGVELLLRDADSCLLLKARSKHEAYSGVNCHSGVVDRPGRTLESSLISDGLEWDSDAVTYEQKPSYSETGKFVQHKVFDSDLDMPQSVTPQWNLGNCGLISNGFYTGDVADTYYGGTVLCSLGELGDPWSDGGKGYVEHRVDLNYKSDMTLPVDEYMEGFATDPSVPDIQLVSGTVIGNNIADPESYGRLLRYDTSGFDVVTDDSLSTAHLTRVGDSWTGIQKDGSLFAKVANRLNAAVSAQTRLNLADVYVNARTVRNNVKDLINSVSDLTLTAVRASARVTGEALLELGALKVTSDSAEIVVADMTLASSTVVTVDASGTLNVQANEMNTLVGTDQYYSSDGKTSVYEGSGKKQTISGINSKFLVDVTAVGIPTPLNRLEMKPSGITIKSGAPATENYVEIDPTKIDITAKSGPVTVESSLGPATIKGLAGGVTLSAPLGPATGTTTTSTGIVSGWDKDPLTGLPLALLGMGSLGHKLSL